MLSINNLHARIGEKEILKGINLEIKPGEVHAIMGPNGSGKSTLASVLAGREDYEVTEGSVIFQGKDILELAPEERAAEGIFLAFQYPVEIPGVSTTNFLKSAVNEIRKYRGEEPMDAVQFLKMFKEKMAYVNIDQSLLSRALNEGFSGGEKKRNEIFQMAVLEPKLAILDETDSGLDIDALRIVAEGVNKLKGPDNATIVVTHYQRLLDYIVPDFVHVLYKGRIVKSGTKELALELEEKGYDRDRQDIDSEEDEEKGKSGYEYLLRLQIGSVTAEKINKLQNDIDSNIQERDLLKSKSEKDLWIEDLEKFETEYKKWLLEMDKETKTKKVRK